MTPPIRRRVKAGLTSVALIALVSGVIALLEPGIPAVGLGVLYLFAVLPIALTYGAAAAVATCLLSMAVYDFFYLGVTRSFDPGSTDNWGALGATLVTLLVVSALAARSRRETLLSARLAQEQAALRRVATLVAEAVPAQQLYEAVIREVGELSGADLARMERYESDDSVTAVAAWSRDDGGRLAVGTSFTLQGASIAMLVRETGRPARVDSFAGAEGPIAREALELGIRASVGCPIVVGARVWGVIAASTRSDQSFPAGTESQIGAFTELIATAVSNAEANAQLVASRSRILSAADEARRRLVRDLHDGAQQRLVHTIVTLKLAQRELKEDDPVTPIVADALAQAEQGNRELRELAHGVLPVVLTRGGLEAGVEALVSRVSVPMSVDVPTERFPPGIEASAYFVIAEALTNVVKHSQARSVSVSVRLEGGALHVNVRDDGIGGARRNGSGLLGLDDRLAAIGGTLRVVSAPGGGTTIAATLPLPPS